MSKYKEERDAAAEKLYPNSFEVSFAGSEPSTVFDINSEAHRVHFKRGWDQALTSSVVTGLVEALRNIELECAPNKRGSTPRDSGNKSLGIAIDAQQAYESLLVEQEKE